MSYISKINPETAGEKEKKVIEEHLAQGYKLANEKLTLLHNARLSMPLRPALMLWTGSFRD